MFTNLRKRTLIAAVLTLAMSRVAAAQGEVGTRASGMAGAFVAVADDASAVYWNPAGVGTGSLVSVVLDAGRFRLGRAPSEGIQNEEDTGAIVALSATAFGFAYYRVGTYGSLPLSLQSLALKAEKKCYPVCTPSRRLR